ncbi:hypothetical protein D918_08883 [Trichuris suis]|nr:hypothetical protein D918_08883 [Trichuris suis]
MSICVLLLKQMESKSEEVNFKSSLIQALVNEHSDSGKLKFRPNAVDMLAYLVDIFVKEGALRAASIAKDDNCNIVDEQHLMKILPQLLLDF